MRILFINLPYYGHIAPTIGLVQELIKQGCEITYMLPFGWEDRIIESGAEFYGYKNHNQLSEQIKNAFTAAEKIIDDFDLVIYEQFFFLGKHLAEKHNKPVVRIFTAPVTNKKLMDEYIRSKGPLHIFRHKWIAKAFTKDIAKSTPLKTDNWLDEIIYNPPELNLVYTLPEYQPYADEFDNQYYKFLGPSVYTRKEDFNFIKADRPVIYISLGTVINGATKFFRECIEAFRGENVDVIISLGKNFKMKKLKNIPQNIHVYSTVPQLKVLEMADVFVTHGGMNSISEALVYSVPMIVIPFHSDQPINAESMEKLGVGIKLEYNQANKTTLKETVFSVMADENIKTNINGFKQKIETAPGNKGGARMIIEYYKNQK